MFEIKEDLTVENILKRISDYDILSFYCKPFKEVGRRFSSELRDDPIPSAMISHYSGKYWYKDFGENIKAVDCFGYIMRKYDLSFMQALDLVNMDFDLGLKRYREYTPSLNFVGLPDKHLLPIRRDKAPTEIVPIFRNWLEMDMRYWTTKYYADIPRLESFGIMPISGAMFGEKYVRLEQPSYSYHVDTDDGFHYYKIYSPYSVHKWWSNCKAHHYLGYNYLPWVGKKVIITKSLKDVVVLSLFKLPAIAPQSEAQVISYDKYVILSKRFEDIYVLYDNDAAGIRGSNETVATYYNIKQIFIPPESGVKDISDFLDKYRYRATQKLITSLVK